jgi:hypothetical protein
MDAISMGLLRMAAAAGGIHAGHDPERQRRLDELVESGCLILEQPKFRLPGAPALEPTYRLTEKGRSLLAQ